MRTIVGSLMVVFVTACGCSDDGGGLGAVTGEEGGPCFANGTCNAGLSCYSDRCVDVPDCAEGDMEDCTCTGVDSGFRICGPAGDWGACFCEPGCGDGVCDVGETFGSCPEDCPSPECGDSVCAAGETCYDGICVEGVPPCLDPADPEFTGWPSDLDLEPNGQPELAVALPCGDDAVATNPSEYASRCPSRQNYTNGFMNLLICPAGEEDIYSVYLLAGETIQVQMLYQYSLQSPRDLDFAAFYYDATAEDYVTVATGMSTNDNDELSWSTDASSGNPEGMYYIRVFGKTLVDVNYYTVAFTLNPSGP